MKLAIISGIIGTVIICMMVILFVHTTELVKAIVSIISIWVLLIEGVILFLYAIWKNEDD